MSTEIDTDKPLSANSMSQTTASLNSETIPLFDLHKNVRHRISNTSAVIKKYSISWIDVIIITFAATICQLIFKCWFVFAAFIDQSYHIQFYELSWSLAMMSLSAIPTLFVAPYLNRYKCNYLCFILLLLCMTCTILNSILSGSIFNLFVVSFVRVFTSQTFWTLGNSIVFHFMQEKDGDTQWRKNTATTIFMGSWTFSTLLFLVIGPLIDLYGFKVTMIMVACLNIAVSVLLFYRMPYISLNDFIEIEQLLHENINERNVDVEDTECNNALLSDVSILFRDIVVVLIMVNTLVCVTNWGMYYGSFGVWLQELFDLNAQTLGLYVTICEAAAETISLCAISILSRYVANHQLCIIGGVCETSSVVILNVILWNGGNILDDCILVLDSGQMQIAIILSIIFLFYMGHEFLYISLMVNIDNVPKKQHNTAVALYGCFDFLGAFIGQTFVTYVFNDHGMVAMAPYMLIVECASALCLISMNAILYRNKKKKTLNVSKIIGGPKK